MKKLNILFPIFQEEPYSYFSDSIELNLVGRRVIAPLRNQMKSGLIVSVEEIDESENFELKKVESIIDDEPFIPAFFMDYISFLAKYYSSTLGEVLKFVLPNGTLPKTKKMVVLNFLPELQEWPKYIGKSKIKYEILRKLKETSYISLKELEEHIK